MVAAPGIRQAIVSGALLFVTACSPEPVAQVIHQGLDSGDGPQAIVIRMVSEWLAEEKGWSRLNVVAGFADDPVKSSPKRSEPWVLPPHHRAEFDRLRKEFPQLSEAPIIQYLVNPLYIELPEGGIDYVHNSRSFSAPGTESSHPDARCRILGAGYSSQTQEFLIELKVYARTGNVQQYLLALRRNDCGWEHCGHLLTGTN